MAPLLTLIGCYALGYVAGAALGRFGRRMTHTRKEERS